MRASRENHRDHLDVRVAKRAAPFRRVASRMVGPRMTLMEVARAMGITHQRAIRIEMSALKKLRRGLRAILEANP